MELDVQKTKDGQLILMHDKTLDRTTTGKGKVAEWTLDSIRTLYLKNGAALKTKHRVPTLEEALWVAKGRVMVNLDKAYPIFDHPRKDGNSGSDYHERFQACGRRKERLR